MSRLHVLHDLLPQEVKRAGGKKTNSHRFSRAFAPKLAKSLQAHLLIQLLCLLRSWLAMSNHQPEIYFDQSNGRTPDAQRLPQMLHRQSSRPFDGYGGMSNGDIFNPQDQTVRYDQNRFERINGNVAPAPYGNDPYQSQSWNPTAFNSNQFPAAYPATTRIRPQQMRGRQPLPNVSISEYL